MIPWLTSDQLVNYTDNSKTIVALTNQGTYNDYEFIYWDSKDLEWVYWNDYQETKEPRPLDTIIKFLPLD